MAGAGGECARGAAGGGGCGGGGAGGRGRGQGEKRTEVGRGAQSKLIKGGKGGGWDEGKMGEAIALLVELGCREEPQKELLGSVLSLIERLRE